MAEDVEENNRRFLEKFLSKEKLDAIYAEYSDWFAKLTSEQKHSRMEWVRVWKPWAEKIREEEDRIKERKKLRYPIIPPHEFQTYQEREHGSPIKLSKKEREEIMNHALIKTPAIKKSESKHLKTKRKRK